MKRQISVSTAILLSLVALLTGGLVMSYNQHHVPVFVSTAQAAGYEAGPLVSFAPVVKRAAPAVVNISSSKVVKTSGSQMNPGMFDDPMFRQFFGGRMPQQQQRQPRSERSQSLGSGVIVSPDGYILTNNHVVEGATEVKVSFADKREYPAKIIGTDPMTDVAVIKIDEHNLPTLTLSDSSHAQIGDVVLAVGDPFGLGQTVTMGIVSATGRSGLGIERFEDFIQTDAPINPGNSGGALINTRGELIGINTAILAGNSGGNQGIGFAIPVNLARNVMDQILKTGKASHGFLGVTLDPITPEKAKAFGLGANGRGVAIANVSPSSPAAKAGLQEGDVIVSLDGQQVDDLQTLRGRIAQMSPGTVAKLGIVRDGKNQDVAVTLGTAGNEQLAGGTGPDADDNGAPNGGGKKGALPGVSVQGLNADLRQQLRLPDATQGVAIAEVDPDSAAAQAGLQEGDVVTQVNRKKVTTAEQFNAAVRQGDGSGSTLLLVRRGGGSLFLVVPAGK
jgi:serine protease Do